MYDRLTLKAFVYIYLTSISNPKDQSWTVTLYFGTNFK
jgi:hypothetical protein